MPCLLIPLTITKVLLDHLAKWYLPAEVVGRMRQKPGAAGNYFTTIGKRHPKIRVKKKKKNENSSQTDKRQMAHKRIKIRSSLTRNVFKAIKWHCFSPTRLVK